MDRDAYRENRTATLAYLGYKPLSTGTKTHLKVLNKVLKAEYGLV